VKRRSIASQDPAIAALLAPCAGTIRALDVADALRSFSQKTDGWVPSIIVGLPLELGPLMGSLLKSAPVTPPAH